MRLERGIKRIPRLVVDFVEMDSGKPDASVGVLVDLLHPDPTSIDLFAVQG